MINRCYAGSSEKDSDSQSFYKFLCVYLSVVLTEKMIGECVSVVIYLPNPL